jgi:hypothetical protein
MQILSLFLLSIFKGIISHLLTLETLQEYSVKINTSLPSENLPHVTRDVNINRRCPYICMNDVLKRIHNNIDTQALFITQTPCFDEDSVGNRWSDYIEARLCANLTGLHFITLSKTCCETITENVFHNILPDIIYHNKPNNNMKYDSMLQICQCGSSCHHRKEALMHKHMSMARDIYLPSVEAHYKFMQSKYSPHFTFDVKLAWKATLQSPLYSQNSLPMIPDVAVHCRCGDNTVGDYSFLPYESYSNKIPRDNVMKNIYILSDNINRKTKPHQMILCNAILSGLHDYLASKFPTSNVITLRGMSPFDDIVRLTYAKLTICSVSTFCLWPAISRTNTVYYPQTLLIANNEQPFYSSNFHWFNDSLLLFGQHALRMTPEDIVEELSTAKV